MKPVSKIFNVIVSIQVVMFIIMVILNYDNLSHIPISFNFSTLFEVLSFIPDISFNINLYRFVSFILILLVVSLVLSLNIVDTGFNDEGSSTFGRYLYFFIFYTLLQVPLLYYLTAIGMIGVILNIFITIIWGIRGIQLMHDKELD